MYNSTTKQYNTRQDMKLHENVRYQNSKADCNQSAVLMIKLILYTLNLLETTVTMALVK